MNPFCNKVLNISWNQLGTICYSGTFNSIFITSLHKRPCIFICTESHKLWNCLWLGGLFLYLPHIYKATTIFQGQKLMRVSDNKHFKPLSFWKHLFLLVQYMLEIHNDYIHLGSFYTIITDFTTFLILKSLPFWSSSSISWCPSILQKIYLLYFLSPIFYFCP